MQTLADLAKRMGSEDAARNGAGQPQQSDRAAHQGPADPGLVVETFGNATAIHRARGLEPRIGRPPGRLLIELFQSTYRELPEEMVPGMLGKLPNLQHFMPRCRAADRIIKGGFRSSIPMRIRAAPGERRP